MLLVASLQSEEAAGCRDKIVFMPKIKINSQSDDRRKIYIFYLVVE